MFNQSNHIIIHKTKNLVKVKKLSQQNLLEVPNGLDKKRELALKQTTT